MPAATKPTIMAGSEIAFELDAVGAANTFTPICQITEIPEFMSESELVESTSICSDSKEYISGMRDGSEVSFIANDVPSDANFMTICAAAQNRSQMRVRVTYNSGRTITATLQFLSFGVNGGSGNDVNKVGFKAKITGDLVFGIAA